MLEFATLSRQHPSYNYDATCTNQRLSTNYTSQTPTHQPLFVSENLAKVGRVPRRGQNQATSMPKALAGLHVACFFLKLLEKKNQHSRDASFFFGTWVPWVHQPSGLRSPKMSPSSGGRLMDRNFDSRRHCPTPRARELRETSDWSSWEGSA